ncbi:MAG: YARHG domain-containing protein [Eubacterium sp.]|nr:YARHG domain-containing protein [Eubacterium sp.]
MIVFRKVSRTLRKKICRRRFSSVSAAAVFALFTAFSSALLFPCGSSLAASQEEGEYIIPDSSIRLLTPAELTGMTKEDLRIARNEIYARHGRMFNSADLNTYFAKKEWYHGTIPADEFDEAVLSDIERKNIQLIIDVENGVIVPLPPDYPPSDKDTTIIAAKSQESEDGIWISPTGYWLRTAPEAYQAYVQEQGFLSVPEQAADRDFLIYDDCIYYLDAVEAGTDGSYMGTYEIRSCAMDGSGDRAVVKAADVDYLSRPIRFIMNNGILYYTSPGGVYSCDPAGGEAVRICSGELVGGAGGYLYILDDGTLYQVNPDDNPGNVKRYPCVPWIECLYSSCENGLLMGAAENYFLRYYDYETDAITQTGWGSTNRHYIQTAICAPEQSFTDPGCVIMPSDEGFQLYDLTVGMPLDGFEPFTGENPDDYCLALKDGLVYLAGPGNGASGPADISGSSESISVYDMQSGHLTDSILLDEARTRLKELIAAYSVPSEFYENPSSAAEVSLYHPNIVGITDEHIYMMCHSPIYSIQLPGSESPRIADAFFFRIDADGNFEFLDMTYYP